jgi:hypothetical protein
MSDVLNILGGPFTPQNLVGRLSETISPSEAMSPLDPSLASEIDEDGTPSMLKALPPAPRVPEAITNNKDDSQGGSTPSDPDEEAQAAKDAIETPSEEITVYANRTTPEPRPFDDETFILMHAYNLVNLRNEKMNFDLPEPPADKLEDVDGDKKPDDVVSNTIRSIKGGLPYAYISHAEHPETNAVIQCIGDPGTFTNYMTAVPNLQSYIESTPAQLSNLVPKMRFYKLFHQDDVEEAVEFMFETAGMGASELEDMVQSRGRKRGYGVGIKSLNINFQGDDTATAKTLVTGDLVLYGSSMESFLKIRRGTGESSHLEYRFMDLAYKITSPRGTKSNVPKGHTEDTSFEIVADVGVANSAAIPGLTEDASSMTVKLKPHGHNFDFQQDGSVTLGIEFSGYINTVLASSVKFDIFSNTDTLMRDLSIELGAKMIGNECGAEKATKFRQTYAAEGNSDYRARIITLNKKLRERGKLYYINISPAIMKAYSDVFNSQHTTNKDRMEVWAQKSVGMGILQTALGTSIPLTSKVEELTGVKVGNAYTNISTASKQAKSMQNDMEEKAPPQSAIRDCAVDPNSNQIPYFYVSDLINLILEGLTQTYQKENIVLRVEDMLNSFSNNPAISSELGVSPGAISSTISSPETYDVVNKLMVAANKLKKFRIVLGPTTIKDFFSESEIVCSIGDIPVPLRDFNSWLVGEMEGKKRTRYSLVDFLAGFIQKYVKGFLRGNPKFNDAGTLGMIKQYSRSSLFGYNTKLSEFETDPLTVLRHSSTKGAGRKSLLYEFVENEYRPLIKTSSSKILSKHKKEGFDYLLFHEPKSPFSTPKSIDKLANVGVGVYQLGKDRGILKEINFSRVDTEYMQESFMMGINGSQDGLAHLTQVFDATLTMYANLNVQIGTYIYIDPDSITPYLSAETKSRMTKLTRDMLGVGGFFLIKGINHSFTQGGFETTLNTQWQPQANMFKDDLFEAAEYGETAHNPLPSIDAWAKNRQKQPDQSDGDKDSACKSSSDGPNKSSSGATLQKAVASSQSMFGGIIDSAVALYKSFFDNSDSEISASDIEGVVNKLGSTTISNPSQGNQNTAHNGPRT